MTEFKLTRSEENYLESMYLLEQEKPAIRVKDIAASMGVRMASVTNILKKLDAQGMVRYERYGKAALTGQGRRYAQMIANRHLLLQTFFHNVLGVDALTAEEDACKVEHALSSHTVERLLNFLEDKGYIDSVQRNIIQRSETASKKHQDITLAGTICLSDLTPGEQGVVRRINGSDGEIDHMARVGIVPGGTVEKLATSAGNDIYIRISGLTLSLTRAEAQRVELTPPESL